nr:hypothetical protein [Spirochaetota bacterium]
NIVLRIKRYFIDDGESIPKNVNFSNDGGSVKMAFIVDKISFNPQNDISEEDGLLTDYTEVFDINEIKVKLK